MQSSALIKGSSNKRERVMKLVFSLLGDVIGVCLFLYRWSCTGSEIREGRKMFIHYREVETKVTASVLPKTGAKWFHIFSCILLSCHLIFYCVFFTHNVTVLENKETEPPKNSDKNSYSIMAPDLLQISSTAIHSGKGNKITGFKLK